jgi:hypothetical protein
VTQVGLHERSAREKISFKSSQSQAHIMNDEATRKFIQALKRLMTFCQRRYPTDPSRSVDFDAYTDQGRGASGAGSDKVVSERGWLCAGWDGRGVALRSVCLLCEKVGCFLCLHERKAYLVSLQPPSQC